MKRVILSLVLVATAQSQQDLDLLAPSETNGIPFIHRESIQTMKFIPYEMDFDIRMLITEKADYVLYESMFNEDYVRGLLREMLWIEERYKNDFIDSQIKRNSGPDVDDGDLYNYHRVSKVYWLTFINKDDYQYIPLTVQFKEWVQLLKAAIDK